MAGHTPGEPLECYSIPIILEKEQDYDPQGNPIREPDGKPKYRCGFRIGGGIDQDPSQSPQGYPDKGIYVTFIHDNSPASRCGLQLHDKLLQIPQHLRNLTHESKSCLRVNGKDFTLVTHKQAVEGIRKKPILKMLIYRKGMPQLQKNPGQMGTPQTQFQAYNQQGPPPTSQHHQQPQQHYMPQQQQQPQYQQQY